MPNDSWNPSSNSSGKTSSNKVAHVNKTEASIIVEKCIGDGACVAFAPNAIRLNSENIAVIEDQNGASDDELLLAAQVCPVKAIQIRDKKSGKKIWPLD